MNSRWAYDYESSDDDGDIMTGFESNSESVSESGSDDASSESADDAALAETTETDIRRALFMNDFDADHVDPARHSSLSASRSHSSTAPVTLPIRWHDDRSRPDPFESFKIDSKERRRITRKVDGKERTVELFESLPPPPNKDYRWQTHQGQHKLSLMMGYDPNDKGCSTKKEVRAIMNDRDRMSSQNDLNSSLEGVMKRSKADVRMNKSHVEFSMDMDTSRSAYANGGLNPVRHDNIQKQFLPNTMRSTSELTPSRGYSESFHAVPRSVVSRTKKDTTVAPDLPIADATNSVHLKKIHALPSVSGTDRAVACFRDTEHVDSHVTSVPTVNPRTETCQEQAPKVTFVKHAETFVVHPSVAPREGDAHAVEGDLNVRGEVEASQHCPQPTHVGDMREFAMPAAAADSGTSFAPLQHGVEDREVRVAHQMNRPGVIDHAAFLARVLPEHDLDTKDDDEITRINAADLEMSKTMGIGIDHEGHADKERRRVNLPTDHVARACDAMLEHLSEDAEETVRNPNVDSTELGAVVLKTLDHVAADSDVRSRVDNATFAEKGLVQSDHTVTRTDDLVHRHTSLPTHVDSKRSEQHVAVNRQVEWRQDTVHNEGLLVGNKTSSAVITFREDDKLRGRINVQSRDDGEIIKQHILLSKDSDERDVVRSTVQTDHHAINSNTDHVRHDVQKNADVRASVIDVSKASATNVHMKEEGTFKPFNTLPTIQLDEYARNARRAATRSDARLTSRNMPDTLPQIGLQKQRLTVKRRDADKIQTVRPNAVMENDPSVASHNNLKGELHVRPRAVGQGQVDSNPIRSKLRKARSHEGAHKFPKNRYLEAGVLSVTNVDRLPVVELKHSDPRKASHVHAQTSQHQFDHPLASVSVVKRYDLSRNALTHMSDDLHRSNVSCGGRSGDMFPIRETPDVSSSRMRLHAKTTSESSYGGYRGLENRPAGANTPLNEHRVLSESSSSRRETPIPL